MEVLEVLIENKMNEKHYKEIKQLETLCLDHEPITLKLELEYKLSTATSNQKSSYDKKANSEFLCYQNQELIGYFGICNFDGRTQEITGMVHPNHRNKGVGTMLLKKIKEELDVKKSTRVLFLCDKKSTSGQRFIRRLVSEYDVSEYEMYLNYKAYQNIQKPISELSFRKADNNDALELTSQNAIYYGCDISELTMIMPEEEAINGYVTYIAELDNKPIGKVNIQISTEVAGIYGVGVRPEFRGRGYGRSILNYAIERLLELKAKQIMLQVEVENANALNLYTSLGFEVMSTMDYFKASSVKFMND